LETLDHIFSELRYYEDRARTDEGSRDTRLGALVALSGAVLGLLATSIPSGHLQTDAVILLCVSVAFFVLAILVATQLVIHLPLISRRFGGHLERVGEVDLSEFDYYLTPTFQDADSKDLQRRVLPVMRSAIGSRRRNVARKERSLAVAIWLIAGGLLTAAAYAAILVL
jgi:hypothetical protein